MKQRFTRFNPAEAGEGFSSDYADWTGDITAMVSIQPKPEKGLVE